DHLEEPLQRARQCARVGRLDSALAYYRTALQRQPRNWVAMNEVALFLAFTLHNATAGLDMARAALGLNPSGSSDLWDTLGDCLFAFRRVPEARQAYLRAVRINDHDVRARLGMAAVHLREKDPGAALRQIAAGLALDSPSHYQAALLQKQQEVL